jgi:hypothetical protein
MSRIGRDDIHLDRLAEEIGDAAGEPVALTVVDGELTVTDITGRPVDIDEGVVADIVAKHDPTPAPTPIETLAAALESDAAVEDKLAAVAVWARAEADQAARPTPTIGRRPDASDIRPGSQQILRPGPVEGVLGANPVDTPPTNPRRTGRR